ncbi:hypothetical protein P167DRAFT_538976 [Morchella conica CCBAS932]|uniref:F-box domain-containing protein n=2 Tax=Morchella sect. Distantes TaxID=1051054 RepID=A0A3N4KHA7_9PEZI|nr:hypothetical protein P167DRAFT_538976 [Morchella conica CCBAS932]
MPIASELSGSLNALSLSNAPVPMSDDDEELLLIGSKLLSLTNDLLGAANLPPPSTATTTTSLAADMEQRRSILELTPPPSPVAVVGKKKLVTLPMELICLALDFVNPRDQKTFAAASKVCRQWYFAATSHLYCYPKITSQNYLKFVSTISPTSTAVKTTPLSSLIRRLDLSRIVHEGKPSFTARLLRRTHTSLEEFVAPQASFGYICLVALSHCKKLRLLDLSLVSQSVSLDSLFINIQDLPHLLTLKFPRSSIFDRGKVEFRWPARIEKFSLAGGISNSFLINATIPPTLKELQISHCPFAKNASIHNLLNKLSQQLTSLSVGYNIPCLPYNALDKILIMCPNLTKLLVAVDYISCHMFDEDNTPVGHPLRRLDLDSSGNLGIEHKVSPDEVFIAVAEERLSELRIVRVSKKLGWSVRAQSNMEDLVDLLEAKSEERGENGAGVGVWEFDNAGEERETFRGFLG